MDINAVTTVIKTEMIQNTNNHVGLLATFIKVSRMHRIRYKCCHNGAYVQHISIFICQIIRLSAPMQRKTVPQTVPQTKNSLLFTVGFLLFFCTIFLHKKNRASTRYVLTLNSILCGCFIITHFYQFHFNLPQYFSCLIRSFLSVILHTAL